MTKVAWFCILLTVVGNTFVLGTISSNENTASSRTAERMLRVDRHGSAMNLDDYRPVDPSPSSKAIKPGPVPHGTPFIPYIPRLSPPDNPSIYIWLLETRKA